MVEKRDSQTAKPPLEDIRDRYIGSEFGQFNWKEFGEHSDQVLRCVSFPTGLAAIHQGTEHFRNLMNPIRAVLDAACSLAQAGGVPSASPGERQSAGAISQMLKDLCYSLMGDWFLDRERARTVFLVNFRELLREHEGKYALLAPMQPDDKWWVAAISPSPREAVEEGRRLGIPEDRMYIEQIVEGADEIPVLEIEGPVSAWGSGWASEDQS